MAKLTLFPYYYIDKNVLFTEPLHESKIYYYHDLNEIMRLSHVPTTNWIHLIVLEISPC